MFDKSRDGRYAERMEITTDAFVNNERNWIYVGAACTLFVLAILILVTIVILHNNYSRGRETAASVLFKVLYTIVPIIIILGVVDLIKNNEVQNEIKSELTADLTEAGYKDILIDEEVENFFPAATLEFKYPKNDELVHCIMLPTPEKDHRTFVIECFNN